jgi:hypothetical protein
MSAPLRLQLAESELAGLELGAEASAPVRLRLAAAHVLQDGQPGFSRGVSLWLGAARLDGPGLALGDCLGRIARGRLQIQADESSGTAWLSEQALPGSWQGALRLELELAGSPEPLCLLAASLRCDFEPGVAPNFSESLFC